MIKDHLVFLRHIVDFCADIEFYIVKHSREKFISRKMLQDAVIRKIEIIGEAVKNLPKEFKEEHPEIPWKDIASMRDKVIHGYFGVDLDLVFDIAQRDIPELRRKIEKFL